MEMCIICKCPIEPGFGVQTPQGPVHIGQCHQHYQEVSVNLVESDSDAVISQTQLLM